MESKETSGSVSRQVNFIEIQLKCIHRRRTSLFIETVHDGPFQLSRNRQIEDERSG